MAPFPLHFLPTATLSRRPEARPSAQRQRSRIRWALAELSEERICLQLVALLPPPWDLSEVRAKFRQLVASLVCGYYHYHYHYPLALPGPAMRRDRRPIFLRIPRDFAYSGFVAPPCRHILCYLVLLDNQGSLVFHHL
jgi:hypothetical protein